VSAGRNPPSVLTIFRFAAYLNLVQEHTVRFGLASCGTDFHSVSGNLRQYHHCTPDGIFFCSVASHLWLSIYRSHFLYEGRSFLCRSSVSSTSSHLVRL